MPIDKSWVSLSRASLEFLKGCQAFCEYSKSFVNSDGNVKCPCTRCCNVNWVKHKNLFNHIHTYGWDQTYTKWYNHGEPYTQTVVPNTNHPGPSDMAEFLIDIRPNEPTQENIGETSNEPTQATTPPKRNEFEALLETANIPLYPGCDWMSSLDFMAKFTNIKVRGKMSDTTFNETLKFLRECFPPHLGYKIPSSYYEIKKTYKTIGLGYESIHACVNDCFLYRGAGNVDLQNCPICNASRWKDKNTLGKKVPNKVLRYFPIIPRLQRLYKSKHTAKHMTWHASGQSTENGKMQHPVDGQAWKKFDIQYKKEFAYEKRNVRLGLAADGFNPYGNLSQSYSMWPVILTTYNMPPWICMRETSLMLTLLIPGPKSPGKDIDIYLRPLIEDLKTLWKDGVMTTDAVTGREFCMKAALLWTINDFPARSSLSGWSGQGYRACPTCNIDTPAIRVLSKIAYVGHRRFLKANNRWRKNKRAFYTQLDDTPPPRKFTNHDILTQLGRLPIRIPGKHPSFGGAKKKRDPDRELNWTKVSIFYELKYWSFLTLKHNLDVMHIEKNVCESVLGTLLMNDKSKDTNKARQDLQNLNIRDALWLVNKGGGKCSKPHPTYSFTTEERKLFCQFIKGMRFISIFICSNSISHIHFDDLF